MHKRSVLLLLSVLCLGLLLGACSKTAEPAPSPTPEPTATPAPTPVPPRVLVVYFSRTGEMPEVGEIDKGNTAILAEIIAGQLHGDLYEIRCADDRYPSAYDELYDLALSEQKEKARPPIAGSLPELDGYEAVFVGAPVWHEDWPMIMYTFFEGADLAGRRLIPFCTNQGSGLSGLDSKLALACPYSQVEKGLAILGTDTQNNPDRVEKAVRRWLEDMGLPG